MLNSGYLANVSTYCLAKPICRPVGLERPISVLCYQDIALAGLGGPFVLCVTGISPYRAE